MLNRVQLIGNLADDAVIRTTQSGVRFATFRLITSDETWNKATGTWEAETTAFDVVVWGHLQKYAEKAALKGRLFFIEGKMKQRRYERDGKHHYAWEAVVNERFGSIRSLSRRCDGDSRGHSDHGNGAPQHDEGELIET